jgi:hypothetical protein
MRYSLLIVFMIVFGAYPLYTADTLPGSKPDRGSLRYNQDVLKHTEQWVVDALYDTVEVIDSLCRKHGIPYTVLSGSLLGSHRDGGLIRWDDDVDIGMLEDAYKKFLTLENELNEQGYEISPSIWDNVLWGHYIYPKNGVPAAHNKKYPAVDLMAFKAVKNKFHYAVKEARKTWRREYFTRDEWSQITDVPFGHLTLRGLTGDAATSYCNRVYGPDWASVAIVWWDHKDDQFIKSEYVRLEEHVHAKRSGK